MTAIASVAEVWRPSLTLIDLSRPMHEIRAELTKHPVATRLSLTGRLVVALADGGQTTLGAGEVHLQAVGEPG